MHHSFLDKYSELESPVHRIHPLVKLCGYGVILLFTLTASIYRPLEFVIAGVLILGVVSISRIPIIYVIRKTLLLSPLMITLLILLPFIRGERILWGINFIFPISITAEGVYLSGTIAVKSVLVFWSSVLLVSTTRFPDLLYALRMVRVPQTMITVLAFMYRYVFLLIDETERMETAHRARLVKRQGLPLLMKSVVYLVRAIFIRSFERSTRVYQAMCARGFRGEVCLLQTPSIHTADIVFLFVFTGLIVVIKLAI